MTNKELDTIIRKYLNIQVNQAKAALAAYDAAPPCCRMANDSLIRATVGTAFPTGIVEDPPYVYKCSTCGTVVKDCS